MKCIVGVLVLALAVGACQDSPRSDSLKSAQLESNSQRSEPEVVEFSCPHNETREIRFSSRSQTDTLAINIVGNDCDTARIQMVATSKEGLVVYENEARALDYVYDWTGAAGVQYMLTSLIPAETISGEDLPTYAARAADPLFGEVNKLAYEDARANDLPIFCHSGGKTYYVCFAYSRGKAVMLYETGT